jgi:alanine racemase
LRFPKLALDGVRLGIALYGTRPSELFSIKLRPVMALKTKISHIHTVPKGEKVSYGGSYEAQSDRILATLPIGYADGFLRAYSGALVKVKTEKGEFDAPIVGRICMDQCMIDITDGVSFLPMAGDEVTLFGDKPERLYEIAEKAGTIPYEVLCAVSSRVIRVCDED